MAQISCCKGVRVFKWDYDLPHRYLAPGFGFFTARLEFSQISSRKDYPIEIASNKFSHSFKFDLDVLSSLDSFAQLLIQEFSPLTPQYTPNTTRKISRTKLRNIFHQVYSRDIIKDHDIKRIFKRSSTRHSMDAEFTARNILWKLTGSLNVDFLSSDFNPDVRNIFSYWNTDLLIEVPGLEKFQRVEFTDDNGGEPDKCAICLEELHSSTEVDKVKITRKTECNHLFHGDCLARWLWRKPSCPMCRLPLLQNMCNG
ncbi:hypothetical protein ACFE04_003321 [Oxalis oulophora]